MAARLLLKQSCIRATALQAPRGKLSPSVKRCRTNSLRVYSMSTEGNHGAPNFARSSISKVGLSALVLMSLAHSAKASQAKNVLGGPLELCCTDPLTGYHRDGYCRVSSGDFGVHAVCAQVNEEFLAYTAAQGNDLSSVVKAGQKWCLCASRWLQAKKAGKAPPVVLESTSEDALKTISLDELKEFAVKKSVS